MLFIVLINPDIHCSITAVRSGVSYIAAYCGFNRRCCLKSKSCLNLHRSIAHFQVFKQRLNTGLRTRVSRACRVSGLSVRSGLCGKRLYRSPRAAGTAVRGWGTCRCSSRPVRTDRRSRPAGRRWQDSKERPRCSTLAGHTPPPGPGTWYLPASAGTGGERTVRGEGGESTRHLKQDHVWSSDAVTLRGLVRSGPFRQDGAKFSCKISSLKTFQLLVCLNSEYLLINLHLSNDYKQSLIILTLSISRNRQTQENISIIVFLKCGIQQLIVL